MVGLPLVGLPAGLTGADHPRFRAFLDTYRDKIRKKLRGAPEGAGREDVLAELEVAARLLGDRRFEVQYEPRAPAGGRRPDFAVTFRVNRRLTLEVTRPRRAGGVAGVLCAKAGQLPAGTPNVLVLATPAVDPAAVQVAARLLQRRAAGGEDAYFQSRGYADGRGFLRALARLSAVLVLDGPPGSGWRNGGARCPLAGDTALALERCLAAPRPADSPLTAP